MFWVASLSTTVKKRFLKLLEKTDKDYVQKNITWE